MANVLENVLSKFNQQDEIYKSVEVKKELDLDYDVGNLLASDSNILEISELKQEPEVFLKSLARDNTQLLINEIWKLPFERFEDVVVVKLPQGLTSLPRSRPVPQAKPLTRWEKYSREKGVQKRKKEKLVWDETAKNWQPRWGYKRRANDEKKDWLIEIPDNADPYVDYFGKKKEEKKERIAKNEFQRLRNIAKSKKIKVPGIGIPTVPKATKTEMTEALAVAKTSTASAGRFTESLPDEKNPKNLGKKRKFESNFDLNSEKKRNLEILEGIKKKRPVLDIPVTKVLNRPAQPEKQLKHSPQGKKKNAHKKPSKQGGKGRTFNKKEGGKGHSFNKKEGGKGRMFNKKKGGKGHK